MILKTTDFLDYLWIGLSIFSILTLVSCTSSPKKQKPEQRQLVLKNRQVQAIVDSWGGGITEFRFLDQKINPLNWRVTEEIEPVNPNGPNLQGHFICLDRWGAPSKAEEAMGMPYHGEAPRVIWKIPNLPPEETNAYNLKMSCTLPIAGLEVQRNIFLSPTTTSLVVNEEIRNTRALGRIFNLVQHPSIAPPFLDDHTIVDSNATRGLGQEEPLPQSIEQASHWPYISLNEVSTDLRYFHSTKVNSPAHDVTSFVFDPDEEFGWVTAASPSTGLLIGYLWRTSQYPWLNLWRYQNQGQVSARGLEFGTTGIHQSFPVLIDLGKVLERQLYEYIEAGETLRKSYILFLDRIPSDFEGVASLTYDGTTVQVFERHEKKSRHFSLEVGKLP